MSSDLELRHNVGNEQTLIAAAIVSKDVRARLIRELPEDAFFAPQHSAIWTSLKELTKRGLDYSPEVLRSLSGGLADVPYAEQLAEAKPEVPPEKNLAFQIGQQRWDAIRLRALTGPINALIDEAKKPNADRSRCRAIAEQIGVALKGAEERGWLYATDDLVRSQLAEIDARMSGRAAYPYGIPALDVYEEEHEKFRGLPRCVPGAKRGQVTVLTASSGNGKSSIASLIALGQAAQRRKVLYAAWEPGAGDMLELMAALSLNVQREPLGIPRSRLGWGQISKAERDALAARMPVVGKWVRFMGNPFFADDQARTAGKGDRRSYSNDRNLDMIGGYVADSGCEVAIFDLWERCLVDPENSSVTSALFRMQRMAQLLDVHFVLLAQQRLKDVEGRAEKRPSREGIKGTSAWVDIADTIVGVYRPSLYKDVADDVVELIVLKQRWGLWPAIVECACDWDLGTIGKGTTRPYDDPTMGGRMAAGDGDFLAQKENPGRPRERRGR